MAEAEVAHQPEAQGAKRGGVIPLVAVLLATLGVGAAAGQKLVGPRAGAVLAERGAAAEEAESHEAPVSALHVVDNLVVNPAASGGSRFLLTTIALEGATPEAAALLATRDVELRHAFNLVLGSRTVESLADVAGRALLLEELMAAVTATVGEGVVSRVLLPQFVIQ
ncbi:MAG TPA: flagellar basal body-associated FliL family protein [Longimicrobiales bacterium]|nr:flagellar basal body-associated FliL family protein [Longimicrobiales bacterium]